MIRTILLTVDYLDVALKLATIVVAATNVVVVVKLFRLKSKTDTDDKENDRRLQLLKTLVLDHNLAAFYSTFDEISECSGQLKTVGLGDPEKAIIDAELAEKFISLRRKFYDMLLAIDASLFEQTRDKVDLLQKDLSDVIFDHGVNLSHGPKYDELVVERLLSTKTQIIKSLFSYRG